MSVANVISQWSFDPAVVAGVALAAFLYWRGRRNAPKLVGGRSRAAAWHAIAFYAALGIIIVALESPIDHYSASLFWAHMLQHLLLIMVAAPLLILGDAMVPVLRGVPLELRRRGLGVLARRPWLHRLGRAFSWFASPGPVFAIFLIDLYLWHWSWLFNLTLRNDAVHLLEHACFLVTALLFWSQIIDQRLMPARLPYARRALYSVMTAAASNLLAMYFVFTPKPVYSAYVSAAHRPFGITALADQQFAGGLMWVPVLFLFGGASAVCFFKALTEDERHADSVTATTMSYSVLIPSGDGTIVG